MVKPSQIPFIWSKPNLIANLEIVLKLKIQHSIKMHTGQHWHILVIERTNCKNTLHMHVRGHRYQCLLKRISFLGKCPRHLPQNTAVW